MELPRRNVLRIGLAAAAALAVPAPASAGRDWKPVADEVRREFLWAWRHYADRAMGADHIKPISAGARTSSCPATPSASARWRPWTRCG